VEADQHPVPGGPDVDLVAVATQLERGPVGLQGVLVGVLGRAAVAQDVGTLAAFGDALVPAFGLGRGFGRDGRRVGSRHDGRQRQEKEQQRPGP
jgi:hypothetical protein